MNRPLKVDVSDLARDQILAADTWWRANRLKAPSAIRDDLERALSLIAFQPQLGALAANASLTGVRRLHLARIRYDLYYREAPASERIEVLAFWHSHRGDHPAL